LRRTVEVCIKRKDAAGQWCDATEGPSGLPTFYEGDLIGLEVTNRGSKPIYVGVLDFGLTRGISLLYPSGGFPEAIAPGGSLQIGIREGDEIELYIPDNFPFVLDPSSPAIAGGVEKFKCIVTTEQTDFSMLTQSGVRGLLKGRGANSP